MYAVGRPHPLSNPARQFFGDAARRDSLLCTSAEVLQELVHVYLATGRELELESSFALIASAEIEVWPLERADVELARRLSAQYPALKARDLCHLASCRRRNVREIKTFDRALAAVADGAQLI